MEPLIVTDEDENRKITATEALKKLDKVKSFIEVNRSNHLNMIFNKLVENVEQMTLKNRKQSDIRSFFRFLNIFYLYCLLVSYEKILHLDFCCLFCPKIPKLFIADT